MGTLAGTDSPTDNGPATGEWQEASEVGSATARAAWAEAARPLLVETARRYHGVVTYKEVAQRVQHDTGIRTSQQQHHWIGDVLTRVSRACSEQGEPLLSSLCVNAQGSVGQGYASAVTDITGETPADPDLHAAEQRLACYRHFEAADLPADGGKAALVPMLAASRERAAARNRKAAQAARPVNTCPTCQMAIPATGVCDNCG
jgi:hypothetical protein